MNLRPLGYEPTQTTVRLCLSITWLFAITWFSTLFLPVPFHTCSTFCSTFLGSTVHSSSVLEGACHQLARPILRNRSAAYRCSQTQPSTPEPPLVYVACVPTALFFEVIRTLQHKRPTRTGVSVRRLHLTFCQSCQADREQVPSRSLDVYQTLWHEGVITMHY